MKIKELMHIMGMMVGMRINADKCKGERIEKTWLEYHIVN